MSQTRAGIFIRRQGGEPRYYARLPGGDGWRCVHVERRVPRPTAALRGYGQLVAEEQRRQLRGALAMPEPMTFAEAARDYLMAKAEEGSVTAQWLEGDELRLKRALAHLGADRELSTIRVADMKGLAAALRRRGLSGGTIRQHLNTVGALYRWAGEAGHVDEGRNPVAAWRRKPSAQQQEARWLEIPDVALLLEAARLYEPTHPNGGRPPVRFIYPLLAAFVLTGGRESEVLGLEVSDVTFDRRTITFRPNGWRRLKTATSHRVVPLWPQLEEILRPYVFSERPPGQLLFPSFIGGAERMVTDWRKVLDAVAVNAGWQPGELRSKMFRHTFCAAALQLLDGDEPISTYTVARWMGHGGTALVNRTHSHLGTVRHRSKMLEYRVDQHAAILGVRLEAVRGQGQGISTVFDTVSGAAQIDRVS